MTATSAIRARPAAVLGSAVARLLPSAVVLWAAMAGVGYLLTHQLAGSALTRFDLRVDRRLAARRTPTWDTATHWITSGAETNTVIAIGAVAFVVLRLVRHRWRESLYLAVALLGEVTIFVTTTLVVDRPRPTVPRLDSAPPTSSFPSGHTAASVALYGSFALLAIYTGARLWLRTLLVAVGVLMPIAVALSRLYRGMHYPTDVIGGALLALIWISVVAAVVLRGHRRAVTP